MDMSPNVQLDIGKPLTFGLSLLKPKVIQMLLTTGDLLIGSDDILFGAVFSNIIRDQKRETRIKWQVNGML